MRKQIDSQITLPAERKVDANHYDDLIAIKVAAENVVRQLGKQHKDLPVMQHLEAALNYKHAGQVKAES